MKHTVSHESTLLKYLFELLAQQSKTSVKKELSDGRIQVNGSVVTAFDHPLFKGDTIELLPKGVAVAREQKQENKETTEHKGVKILFEDEHIIVIDKKAGVPTVVQTQGGETAYSILTDYVKRNSRSNWKNLHIPQIGPARVFIVHRLDKGTSGVLVFAKTERAKELFQSLWSQLVISRKYIAIVEGKPVPPRGKIESYLYENPKSLRVHSSMIESDGKLAITRYNTIESSRNGKFSKVEFELETGRKNQIRVHCASELGCPIVGDRKYGCRTNDIKRLALHAATLEFHHPITNEVMRFTSPLPDSFKQLV